MAVGRLGPRSPRREEGAMTSEVRPDTAVLVRERLSRDADDPDALFTLAALRANDGDLDEALPILDRVLRIDPRHPGAWSPTRRRPPPRGPRRWDRKGKGRGPGRRQAQWFPVPARDSRPAVPHPALR